MTAAEKPAVQDLKATWRDKTFLTVAEAAIVLEISQGLVRRSIKAEEIPCIRFGGKFTIPVVKLRRFIGEEVGQSNDR